MFMFCKLFLLSRELLGLDANARPSTLDSYILYINRHTHTHIRTHIHTHIDVYNYTIYNIYIPRTLYMYYIYVYVYTYTHT